MKAHCTVKGFLVYRVRVKSEDRKVFFTTKPLEKETNGKENNHEEDCVAAYCSDECRIKKFGYELLVIFHSYDDGQNLALSLSLSLSKHLWICRDMISLI
ncbi:unnamed protein product [Camellia sinensis]